MQFNSLIKNGIIGHTISVGIFILITTGAGFYGCKQKHQQMDDPIKNVEAIQNFGKPLENSRIIDESAVIFLAISDKDYSSLIAKTPPSEDQLSELMSDFYYSARKIARKLEPLGIMVKSETWTEMWFQVAEGSLEKVTFDPRNIYGMVLYAKGKSPILATKFYLQFSAMAKIVSKYFNIEIEE